MYPGGFRGLICILHYPRTGRSQIYAPAIQSGNVPISAGEWLTFVGLIVSAIGLGVGGWQFHKGQENARERQDLMIERERVNEVDAPLLEALNGIPEELYTTGWTTALNYTKIQEILESKPAYTPDTIKQDAEIIIEDMKKLSRDRQSLEEELTNTIEQELLKYYNSDNVKIVHTSRKAAEGIASNFMRVIPTEHGKKDIMKEFPDSIEDEIQFNDDAEDLNILERDIDNNGTPLSGILGNASSLKRTDSYYTFEDITVSEFISNQYTDFYDRSKTQDVREKISCLDDDIDELQEKLRYNADKIYNLNRGEDM